MSTDDCLWLFCLDTNLVCYGTQQSSTVSSWGSHGPRLLSENRRESETGAGRRKDLIEKSGRVDVQLNLTNLFDLYH